MTLVWLGAAGVLRCKRNVSNKVKRSRFGRFTDEFDQEEALRERVAIVCFVAVTCFAGMGWASSARSGFAARAGEAGSKIGPHDAVLYDNGPDDGGNAYSINMESSVANSFEIGGAGSTLTSVTFSNWLLPGNMATSVDWAITSFPFDGTVAFGTAPLTGVDQGINRFGFDVVEQTFSVSEFGLNLDSGTYYLQLGNEIVSNDGVAGWGESNGPSFACQSLFGMECTPISSESFQITGSNNNPPPSVPEPGSWVLLGTGLLGMAGMVRGKWKV